MRKKTTRQLVAEARQGKPLPWNEDKEKLKGWRTALDLSQADLAREAHVSQALIAQIETGRHAFNEPHQTKIWDAVGNVCRRRSLEPNPTGVFGYLAGLVGGTGQLAGLSRTPWERVGDYMHQVEQDNESMKASNRLAWDNVRVLVDLLDRRTEEALKENEKEAVEGIRENVRLQIEERKK